MAMNRYTAPRRASELLREHLEQIADTLANSGQEGFAIAPSLAAADAEIDKLGTGALLQELRERTAELRAMTRRLEESEERSRALVGAIPDLLFRIRVDGVCLDVKADDRQQLAMPADQIIGAKLSDMPLPRYVSDQGLALIKVAVETGKMQAFEYQLDVPAGREIFECRIVKSGEEECLCIIRNVTARAKSLAAAAENMRKLEALAAKDPLTAVFNLRALEGHLGSLLAAKGADGRRVGVLFLDMDRFKPVNDAMGHEAGDELLKMIAGRVVSCLRESDCVARIGGDEFVVAIGDCRRDNQLVSVANKLIAAIGTPYELRGGRVCIGVSIGIARFPQDGSEPGHLIRNADAAMYRAKKRGGNQYELY